MLSDARPPKDPRLVDAGRRGAEARWGRGRIIRLDALTQPQRDVILALVEAAKAANRVMNVAAAGSNGDGLGAGRDVADSAAD